VDISVLIQAIRSRGLYMLDIFFLQLINITDIVELSINTS